MFYEASARIGKSKELKTDWRERIRGNRKKHLRWLLPAAGGTGLLEVLQSADCPGNKKCW
jgi:hypothetical protein